MKDKFFGIAYVGTSRVEALQNLLIDSFDEDRFILSEAVQAKLKKIIAEEKRLNDMFTGKF
jgi:hypothetical protein